MEIVTVNVEIYQGNTLIQQQQISMPLIMLYNYFMDLVNQAASQHGSVPIRVKIWQPMVVQDNNIEISIEFRNLFEE